MYSRELEELIANCIQDGMIDESERLAIINRAQREGVDINEINVVLKNRLQKNTHGSIRYGKCCEKMPELWRNNTAWQRCLPVMQLHNKS